MILTKLRPAVASFIVVRLGAWAPAYIAASSIYTQGVGLIPSGLWLHEHV